MAVKKGLDIEQIKNIYGDAFVPFSANEKLLFTEDCIILKLSRPIQTEDGETAEINLREPEVSDLKKIDALKGEVEKTAALLASCSSILPVYVNKIKGRDFMLAGEVLGAFLASGPKTGVM